MRAGRFMTLPHKRMIGAIIPPSAGNCNRKFPERAVFSGSRLAKDTVIGYTVKQPEGNCTRLDSGYETSQRTGGARPGPSSSKAAPGRFHRKFTAFPSAFLVFPAGVCYHAYHILLTKKFHMRNTPQGGLLTLCPIRKRIAIPAETATSAF